MLYLHYDAITTALLPYFLFVVYFSIDRWVRLELAQCRLPDPSNIPASQFQTTVDIPIVRPEQVFQLLDEDEHKVNTKKTSFKRESKHRNIAAQALLFTA